MLSRFIVLFCAVSASLPFWLAPSQAACPAAAGETAEDCPWAELAREAARATEAGGSAWLPIAEGAPDLVRQIEHDALFPRALELWGQSINYDELARGTIVHPAILDRLLERIGGPSRRERIVHAGVEHTYGYLFSVLPTPYGYKRARWVRDDIEKGFGLPRGELGPSPSAGTLFLNVTALAGGIALNDDSQAQALLESLREELAPSVASFDYSGLNVTRLEETVRFRDRTLQLRTDFVPFRNAPSDPSANAALLVYSVRQARGRIGFSQLITAFPVTAGFVQSALKPSGLGDDLPVTTRYNAYVLGMTQADPPLRGTRRAIPRLDARR